MAKKTITQKPFLNKEIDIEQIKRDYEKIQRMDKKRLSKT